MLNSHLSCVSDYPRFVVSKIIKGREGEILKIPCDPNGHKSDHTNPANHLSLEECQERVKKLGSDFRVGLSIVKSDNFFLLDIDNAYDREKGAWSSLAKDLRKRFVGCYTEISQSGSGIHIIGRVNEDIPHVCKNTRLDIEFYTDKRFVVLTGYEAEGDWLFDATEQAKETVREYFSKEIVIADNVYLPVNNSDEEIINKASSYVSDRSELCGTPTFKDLYRRNVEVLSKFYPPKNQSSEFDESSADFALALQLAYHTRGDREQIARIMWSSELVRPKWKERKSYVLETVENAVSKTSFNVNSLAQHNTVRNESQGMPEELLRCYYVKSLREIYSVEHGFLNEVSFNFCFNKPFLREKPYATFQKYAAECGLLVNNTCFRPELANGAIIEREGETSVNCYKPISIAERKGDITPFYDLLEILYPDERDREILMSYAAICAQKPGVKSQWCPVLQGTQGCGKSIFADIVAYACGERYVHRAKGSEFENRFHSQWYAKTLILVEDPVMKEAKLDEVMKPLITSTRLAFEGKGVDIFMGDFPANFIITVNDFERIQKKEDSRRFAVFMSAIQTPRDLAAAGLTPSYFRKFVNWRDSGGYQYLANHLLNYTVKKEFDFSEDCVVAPMTSTTSIAIESSRSEVELRILEECEQGRAGMKNGWISSTVLTDFLISNRLKHHVKDNRRTQILEQLGYILHPYLPNGRSARACVAPDNKRPYLYVKRGHAALQEKTASRITDMYEADQK
jgi:hypothetical protein